MTTETIIKMLKSPIEEDQIIVGNWMVRNMTLPEIKKLFDEYGDPRYNIEDYHDYYISGKYIGTNRGRNSIFCYIKKEDFILFLSSQVWLLKPSYLEDVGPTNLNNVEI